jgi:ABC-type glycerol-3-phosphate transport system substrate-binding protein
MMTGFRTMAVLAVAGLTLAACATRDLNNGNDQGFGDYGSNKHRQPYTVQSTTTTTTTTAPTSEAAGSDTAAH